MDVETVEKLVRVLSESARLTEMEVCQGDVTIRLRRPAPAPVPARIERALPSSRPTASPVIPAVTPPVTTGTVLITSEFVGVFHAPAQHAPVLGASVTEKQVLGQIETMRLMNPVVVSDAGRLQTILVQDGQPVEYGQPLFEIVPEEPK